MRNLPLVSSVTASYNQAQFLEETVRSVLEQDYPRGGYIICDGGATDGSVETEAKHEKYLGYSVRERDKGQSNAVNKGWFRRWCDSPIGRVHAQTKENTTNEEHV